jgi:hypothetical protein
VVHKFAVQMEKSPGVVSVISAVRMAPPTVTEVDGDGVRRMTRREAGGSK